MLKKFANLHSLHWFRSSLVVAIVVCLTSCSDTKPAAPIEIKSVYMKALAPNQTSAPVYLKIANNSKMTQALNYVHSQNADYIEIRRTIYDAGAEKQLPVQRLSVNPSQTKTLAPSGYHLMLHGIYDNLEPGDKFDITFEFESGEVIITQVEVRARS